jgi:tripartite-type tricarboxylate transporter receptor subunit TctC
LAVALPQYLIVGYNSRFKTLADLVQKAKSQPEAVSYGSAGNGGGTHLAGELFKSLSGTDIVHVPYKGSAPAMTDVLGGQVQLMFADGPTALPQIGGGKVRALMVAQAKRSALFPEVPSATEVGLPGYDAYSWAAFVLPAGVPREHAEKLSNEITKALSNAEVRKQLLARGAEAQPGNAEAFTKFMRDEMSKWARVVKSAGIQAD